jgi:hypothetical protein
MGRTGRAPGPRPPIQLVVGLLAQPGWREAAAGQSRGQIARLGLQSFADAPLAISRPSRREAIVHHVIALDAECVPDHLGGAVSVVAVDRLLEKVGHGTPHSRGGQLITRALAGPTRSSIGSRCHGNSPCADAVPFELRQLGDVGGDAPSLTAVSNLLPERGVA